MLANQIKGTVKSITDCGDLITDISNDQIVEIPNDDSVSVKFGPHQTIGIHDPNHNEPDATLLAMRGSSGFLELTIVGVSLSEMLAIQPGEEIEVCW